MLIFEYFFLIYNIMEQLFYKKTGITLKFYIENNRYKHLFYINRYKLRENPDDLLQDYYMHILSKIDTFDAKRASFETFDYLVLDSYLKKIYNKENKIQFVDITTDIEFIDSEYDFEVEEKVDLIKYILETNTTELNVKIFFEKYIDGLSLIDIAKLNDLNVQKVKNRLFYTTSMLKDYFR